MLVSKYFVIYTLTKAKKRPLYVKQLTPMTPSYGGAMEQFAKYYREVRIMHSAS